ncbi:MAG: ABC transporter permease, partial [Mediterraneibacter sp.]
MLYKLAFRNARRSLSDYAVYLITVTLSFSLMFAFGLVTSSDAIAGLSEGMATFRMILDFINVIILFVLCFLINYTTKFMFTKRS